MNIVNSDDNDADSGEKRNMRRGEKTALSNNSNSNPLNKNMLHVLLSSQFVFQSERQDIPFFPHSL